MKTIKLDTKEISVVLNALELYEQDMLEHMDIEESYLVLECIDEIKGKLG